MSGHAPTPEAVEQVVDIFAAHDISLHIEIGEEIKSREPLDLDAGEAGTYSSFDEIKLGASNERCGGHFGTLQDRKCPNCEDILLARKHVFRYGIFGDQM